MESPELRESILEFAKQQTEPFTTGYIYENVKEADSLSDVSNSLRKLVISGHLARKKIDNVRYVYILAERAPADFETAIVADGKNNAAEKAAKKQEIKPTVKPSNAATQETTIPHDKRESEGSVDLLTAGKAEYDEPGLKNISTDKNNIGKRIKDAIGTESVNAFAKRFDIPESSLRAYIENQARPGVDALIAISEATGVTVDWLATGKEFGSFSTLDAAENMVPGLKPFVLPDSFTLKLQTPGGLIITITNGNVTA